MAEEVTMVVIASIEETHHQGIYLFKLDLEIESASIAGQDLAQDQEIEITKRDLEDLDRDHRLDLTNEN